MSHGADEGENYWPGYVDALTSMVQVLAFVMMLLSMAVFVLSQNAAKSAVEAIARAEQVNVPKNANVTELTEAIIEKVRKRPAMQSASNEMRQVDASAKGSEGKTQVDNRLTASTDARTVDGRVDSPQTSRLPMVSPVDRPGPPSLAAEKRLAVRFEDRGFDLNAREASNVGTFVEEQLAAGKNVSLGVRAYAYSGGGRLTEERRVAYYRALVVRAALIGRKASAGNLQIKIFDTLDREQGSIVDIFVIKPGVD
jgi:hypothetical protein